MKILFDDWVERYDDMSTWACMCESCRKKHHVPMRYLDDTGEGICSVKGCENEADYYKHYRAGKPTVLTVG